MELLSSTKEIRRSFKNEKNLECFIKFSNDFVIAANDNHGIRCHHQGGIEHTQTHSAQIATAQGHRLLHSFGELRVSLNRPERIIRLRM